MGNPLNDIPNKSTYKQQLVNNIKLHLLPSFALYQTKISFSVKMTQMDLASLYCGLCIYKSTDIINYKSISLRVETL